MSIGVRYSNDDDEGAVVIVEESRPAGPIQQTRTLTRKFGKGAKAADDGLIFVHGVNHGEIKPDDILPPWGRTTP